MHERIQGGYGKGPGSIGGGHPCQRCKIGGIRRFLAEIPEAVRTLADRPDAEAGWVDWIQAVGKQPQGYAERFVVLGWERVEKIGGVLGKPSFTFLEQLCAGCDFICYSLACYFFARRRRSAKKLVGFKLACLVGFGGEQIQEIGIGRAGLIKGHQYPQAGDEAIGGIAMLAEGFD